MSRLALPLAVLAACSTAPEPPQPVVQKLLRAAPMRFHPELPLVGQEDGARCDVWDLASGLYRGAVAADDCRRWDRPRPPLPPDLAAATPDLPAGGALLWAASIDGHFVATSRRGGQKAWVWDAETRKLVKEITVAPHSRPDTSAIDLMWTRGGRLVIAASGEGPVLWDPAAPNKEPADLVHRLPDRHLAAWVDPAGRYLGFSGEGYRKPLSLTFAGVIGFNEAEARSLVLAERIAEAVEVTGVAWAAMRPSAFLVEARSAASLDLCGRRYVRIVAVDPGRGVSDLSLDPTRKLTLLAPSPDGTLVLVGSDDGPPLPACEGEQDEPTSADKGPVLRLWEPATGRRREVLRAPATAAAWAPDGSRFVVKVEGREHVFEGPDARPAQAPPVGPSFHWAGPVAKGDSAALAPGFLAGPDGRWAVAEPDPDLPEGGLRLRRLADGDTMFFPDERDHRAFTGSGAFSIAPPAGLAFRLGGDVLRAPVVRASEATFRAPIPDLGERFIRGERLAPSATR